MFRKIALLLLALFSAFALPAQAVTLNSSTLNDNVGFISTTAYVSAPAGFLDFCNRYPEDCLPMAANAQPLDLTTDRMRELNTVNSDVNDTLFFNSDVTNTDFWDYPQDNIGDCEDFVIEKRRRLMDLGWPEEALLITVVKKRVPDFAGRTSHAVLTARTAQGDYVLDNTIRAAVPWKTAMQIFVPVMIQTQIDPKVWALTSNRAASSGSVDSKVQLP